MSQLGMMVIAIGLSCYNLALYHLINHAFYKGLLFLGAGSIIHATGDNQDFRKYGGLISYLPLTYSCMVIASFSLIAIPFLSGFYSKDYILESLLGEIKRTYDNIYYINNNYIIFYIGCIGAIFTTLYSIKVLYFTFLSKPNGPKNSYNHVSESNIFITLPLIILSIFSIYFGYISQEIYLNVGLNTLQDNSIFIHPNNEIKLYVEYSANLYQKLLPFFFTIFSIIISLVFFEKLKKLLIMLKINNLGYNLFCLFNKKLFIDYIYNKYIILFTVIYTGG
jgi:NADH-ubiquinone oxidoreductase chain 5